MSWIEECIKSNCKSKHIINGFFIFTLFVFVLFTANPIQAISNSMNHNNISGNITDNECIICHPAEETQFQPEDQLGKPLIIKNTPKDSFNSLSQDEGNYTAILTFGQTPYQLGAFYRTEGTTGLPRPEGYNGWSWWDTGNLGAEKQKNQVILTIFNNSKGTVNPITGLTTLPSWPLASYRNNSPSYSYKADNDNSPITAQNNYPDQMDIWMIKEVNLTGVTNANLTFWTWYSMEADWDYGYIAVNVDGNSWTNLAGTITTNTNPNSNNLGNGITGESGDWIQETMNLTPYAGNRIFIRFRFKSDAAVNGEGWYIDDIKVTSDTITVFTDEAENPTITKSLSVNVTYPHLSFINATDPLTSATGLQYSQNTQQVYLQEDIYHPGTYIGYYKYDPFTEQYSGNYTVVFDTTIDGNAILATTQFQTTLFGCQTCHNRKLDNIETSFIHSERSGVWSCMAVCHSGSRGFYDSGPQSRFLEVNPMHVHEMQYGHVGGFLDVGGQTPYIIPSHVSITKCEQCHTSFIHDNIGTDTSKIASYALVGTNISYSTGVHNNLTCENCHGSLDYPTIPPNQYQLKGILGEYKPTFTSHISFTDTYAIAVNGTENLNITITADNTTKGITVFTIGPVDNVTSGLQAGPYSGYINLETPANFNIANPYNGTWLTKLIQLQEGTINYTIESNYPIEWKPIIKIPECNDCHNSTASNKAETKYEIPDWNPGFAHVDINNDGTLDIQCRMCHDTMHNITIKNCQTCHTRAPISHPIPAPSFSQYSQTQCLSCHGDPHKVTMAGGGCVGCHSSPGTRYYVDTSMFAGHANLNTSDGTNNVTDADCMTCHFRSSDIIMSPDAGLGAANHSNTYFCDDCHTTDGPSPVKPPNPALMKNGLSHGSTNCQWCHIAGDPLPRPLDTPLRFHPNGPKGTASGKNCLTCHYYANLPDLPFHAPGEVHEGELDQCGYCHDQSDNHGVTPMSSNTLPTISELSATTPVFAGSPVQVQATVTDDMMQIAAAQYQVKKGSIIVKEWTNMTPKDGQFNSSNEVVNASFDTSSLLGTYTVYVKGMASAPKTGGEPYYPLNGQWGDIYSSQFTVKQPEGYDNGTVYGSLGARLAGVIVSTDTGISTTTNETGFYSLSLANGTYQLTASKEPEYYPNGSVVVTVKEYTTVTQDITLTAKLTGRITGAVKVK